MQAGFRQCYQNLLNRNGDAEGKIRLLFSVDCDGNVRDIHATALGLDREIVECMFLLVAQARFDPPEGGSARVHVPVTFVREKPSNSK